MARLVKRPTFHTARLLLSHPMPANYLSSVDKKQVDQVNETNLSSVFVVNVFFFYESAVAVFYYVLPPKER